MCDMTSFIFGSFLFGSYIFGSFTTIVVFIWVMSMDRND